MVHQFKKYFRSATGEAVVLGGIGSDNGDHGPCQHLGVKGPVFIAREHRRRTGNAILSDLSSANKGVGDMAIVSRRAPALRVCFEYEF